MKAKELIEILTKLDPDEILYTQDYFDVYEVTNVTQSNLSWNEDKRYYIE